jgi:hypothetical protein
MKEFHKNPASRLSMAIEGCWSITLLMSDSATKRHREPLLQPTRQIKVCTIKECPAAKKLLQFKARVYRLALRPRKRKIQPLFVHVVRRPRVDLIVQHAIILRARQAIYAPSAPNSNRNAAIRNSTALIFCTTSPGRISAACVADVTTHRNTSPPIAISPSVP